MREQLCAYAYDMQIRRSLLEWYDEHHRVLPWRRNYHSRRLSGDDNLSGAPLDLPLDVFMYYVMVCEVRRPLHHLLLPAGCNLILDRDCYHLPSKYSVPLIQAIVQECCLLSFAWDRPQMERSCTMVQLVMRCARAGHGTALTADASNLCCMQVMSQQTQLSRVIEYFNRWIARWPTVQVTPSWA